MAFFDTERLARRAERLPAEGPRTGFAENIGAQFDRMRLMNRSNADLNALSDVWEDYIEELERDNPNLRLGNPAHFEVAPGVTTALTVESAERVVMARIEAAGVEPRTPADLRREAGKRAGRALEEAERIGERADELGTVGGFLGKTGGVLLDPPVLGSMLFGAPFAAGVIRTGAIEFAIAGGVEIAIQPILAQARTRLGTTLTMEEALENVMFAALGGAVFGAGLKALGRGAGLVSERLAPAVDATAEAIEQLPATPEVRDAAVFVQRGEELSEATPFSRADFVAQREHIDRLDAAITAGRQGEVNPPVVGQRVPVRSETLKGQEPTQGDDLEAQVSQLGASIRRVLSEEIEAENVRLKPAENVRVREQQGDDTGLAELLEMVKLPSKRPRQPEGLASFLKREGGIRDEGGDIRRGLGIRPQDRPGLVNKEGLDPDEAALRAQEAGFFPGRDLAGGDRIDVPDLLDALDEDLRRGGRFSEFDEPELQTLREVEDLEEAISLAGVNLSDVTPEDLPTILSRPGRDSAQPRTLDDSALLAERMAEPFDEAVLEANVRGDLEGAEDDFLLDLEDGGEAVTARQMLDEFDENQRALDEFANCALGITL